MKTKKRRKIRYKRILFVLFFLFLIIFLSIKFFNIRITNIYISGNNILTDQEVIDIAKVSDYPKSINNPTWTIEKRLESNILIKHAFVSKNKGILKINIEENNPLFYDSIDSKTVLSDKSKIDIKFDTPVLINTISSDIYDEFIDKMNDIDINILKKISEIKYDPNDIDNKRFLLTMVDGNYVYITINKFDLINNYISIIKNFNNKKGILYLDAGNVFEYFE